MESLVFVSMEDWDEIWRRNQFFCSIFSQRYPECKILFVGTSRDVSNQLRHGRLKTGEQATWVVPEFPNITVTRPLKLFPNTLTAGRLLNESLMRRHVRQAAAQIGMRSPVLWLNPHYALHMAGQMHERAVVYDITDDWTTFTQSRSLTRLTIEQDAQLCRRADAVIVCSQKLFDLKKAMAQNLYLIPNGVDANHYSRVLESSDSAPNDAWKWPAPVIGYTGTIHPDRVDVGLIESVARLMPEASFVFIGPNHLPSTVMDRLRQMTNLFFVGSVPYRDIPNAMCTFDVCMTPHLQTAFTESLNPIKLWEYLAAGKPIVATNVAGFRDYPQYVRLASDAESFVQAIKASLVEGNAIKQDRRLEARRHSWDARADAIEAVLRALDCTATGALYV